MKLRPLRVAASTAARRVVVERGGLVVSVAFYCAVTAVLGSLWRAAALRNGGEVAGYSALALSWYIAASEAATVSLNLRTIETVGDDIASGAVASEMLRPASVVAVRIASEVGRALPRLAACAIAGVGITAAVAGAPPNPAALALAMPAMVLAITCNLVAQHAVAAAAFWVREARATWFLYQKFVFIVGGMLLPLEVLPPAFERVARALPFMTMAYAPARLASGHFEPGLLVVQLAWLGVLSAAAFAAFAAGERRLQVVGG